MIPFWNYWDHRIFLGIVWVIFGHHQDDQKGQEYLKNRVLEDFGFLDANYDFVTHHIIPFWKYCDKGNI